MVLQSHCPDTHAENGPHALPQTPQLFSSDATQAPLQTMLGGSHGMQMLDCGPPVVPVNCGATQV